MFGFSKSALLLGCAVLTAGCIDSTALDTPRVSPIEVEAPSSVTLEPDSLTLGQGENYQLAVMVRNQNGQPMPSATIDYSTTAPLVAAVSRGLVVAVAPGRAVIRASTTNGHSTLVDSTIVFVHTAETADHIVLSALTNGWSPPVAHLSSGGQVTWLGGFIAVSGVPVHTVYLWRNEDGETSGETIDMTPGSASRTLTKPGSYTYCSNACWDPPESGVIIVH